MLENGKLDKVINEALDENSNPFLKLAHGSVYSTAFAFSYYMKNYPLLLKMYNNCIKLNECRDKYVTKKIKCHCKFILSTQHNEAKGRFYLFRCNALFKRTWFINNELRLHQSRKFDFP